MSKSNEKTILLIEKTGLVKELQIKEDFPSKEFYKKAGLKSLTGFAEQYVWETQLEDVKYSISLFGKKSGRVSKNVYDFPPPLEDSAFYGNCLIVNNLGSINKQQWSEVFEIIYEKYQDNGDNDDEPDDEDEIEKESDDEESNIDEADIEDLDEDIITSSKRKKKTKKEKPTDDNEFIISTVEDTFLDCTQELEPEEYV
jgi:hypothetical protein